MHPFKKNIIPQTHTSIYKMHRYFARRPHNVFSELIKHYTSPNDIVLDPFCGGGVTVIESLALGRKAIGVDVNPLATHVTRMEVTALDTDSFLKIFTGIEKKLSSKIQSLYETRCPRCKSTAQITWCEWNNETITRISYSCSNGHKGKKKPSSSDQKLSQAITKQFSAEVKRSKLWYPKSKIPKGDKTLSIINKGYHYFWQLFTQRNLLALAYLYKEISKVREKKVKDFLHFALSASLKWASKQCHLRGDVIEGWAMHAYWVYPKQLEINVWQTFTKRIQAIIRGKKYAEKIGVSADEATDFRSLQQQSNALLLSRSADQLPIPDKCIDCIITDPPYGDNVNYAELSDFWTIWNPEIRNIVNKKKEAVINKTQSKDINRYEELLAGVFTECNRVLNQSGMLVATFNSKDLQIVSTFLRAVAAGGFELMKNGIHYQEPIKAYTTTVHAKEVGAFTGDFIFTFKKTKQPLTTQSLQDEKWKTKIVQVVNRYARRTRTEIEFRRTVYEHLIPLFARWAFTANGQLIHMASFAEQQMRKQEFDFLPFEKARAIAR